MPRNKGKAPPRRLGEREAAEHNWSHVEESGAGVGIAPPSASPTQGSRKRAREEEEAAAAFTLFDDDDGPMAFDVVTSPPRKRRRIAPKVETFNWTQEPVAGSTLLVVLSYNAHVDDNTPILFDAFVAPLPPSLVDVADEEIQSVAGLRAPQTFGAALQVLLARKMLTLRPVPGGAVDEAGCVEVCLTPKAFETPNHPSDYPSRKHHYLALRLVITACRGLLGIARQLETLPFGPQESVGNFRATTLYDAVRRSRGDETPLAPQPPELKSTLTLRPYQRRALAFMLDRERHMIDSEEVLHPLWVECRTAAGARFYYCPMAGTVTMKKFLAAPDAALGGILAEEMGLGKTVETISCILSNRYPGSTLAAVKKDAPMEDAVRCVCGSVDDNGADEQVWLQCDVCDGWLHARCVGREDDTDGAFICVACVEKLKQRIHAKTTLIVSPDSIVHQWSREIGRHVADGALSVFHYKGVRAGGWVSPLKLASYDVVLTTYSVLKTEIYHLTDDQAGNLRSQKRFTTKPTPLTALVWWRVCLDEAQMIETSTAQAAKMALQLDAVHRWCVTGTPIQRGLEDLYGLFLFLGIDPFNVRHWWMNLVQRPYLAEHEATVTRFHAMLRQFMWRSNKADVEDEICLPPQTAHQVKLRFSAVEAHFYRKQHEECTSVAGAMLRRGAGYVTQARAALITSHVLRLRQACCHPDVGSRPGRSLQKNAMTMDQLLEELTVKAKIEAQDSQRSLIAAVNGLAALALIDNDAPTAAQLYRAALQLAEDNAGLFEADRLQRFHIFVNLAGVLEAGAVTERTLRDERLRAEADEIRNYYLKEGALKVQVTQANFESATKAVEDAQAELDAEWWDRAVQLIEHRGGAEEFLARARDALATMQTNTATRTETMATSFRDTNGLRYSMTKALEHLVNARSMVLRVWAQMNHEPSRDEVERSAHCGKCRPNQSGPQCQHCVNEKHILALRRRLFTYTSTAMNNQIVREDGFLDLEETEEVAGEAMELVGVPDVELDRSARRGVVKTRTDTKANSEAENVLKVILSSLRQVSPSSPLLAFGKKHLEMFEALKKEFMYATRVWMAQKDRLSSVDELEMAAFRIRLRFEGEQVPDHEVNFKLRRIEVPSMKIKLEADRAVATASLQRGKSQLEYLKQLGNLRHVDLAKQMCPVCHDEVGKDVVILICGHTLCYTCAMALVAHAPRGTIKCPTCRAYANIDEISYVTEQAGTVESGANTVGIAVEGSFGTKLENVVRQLLAIQREDPEAKSLVFSQWHDVLDIVCQALAANGIRFNRIKNRRTFQSSIDAFKADPALNVLVLPLQSGGNGLNLVEATNVFLVEPNLNVAIEEQAVSRVHRIGQTRPTHVYRFMISDTVEERILTLAASKQAAQIEAGVANSRGTQEVITLDDVSTLFSSELSSRVAPDAPPPHVQLQAQGRFWAGTVRYKERPTDAESKRLTRDVVVRKLEQRYSWECITRNTNMAAEPQIKLLGRDLPEAVAKQLLVLPAAGSDMEDAFIAAEVQACMQQLGIEPPVEEDDVLDA